SVSWSAPRRIPVLPAGLEVVQLLFRLVLGDAVLLLDLAGELVTVARDHVALVVRERAPLLLRLALQLLPVPFGPIPIHPISSDARSVRGKWGERCNPRATSPGTLHQ